jgi:hypothetical protein
MRTPLGACGATYQIAIGPAVRFIALPAKTSGWRVCDGVTSEVAASGVGGGVNCGGTLPGDMRGMTSHCLLKFTLAALGSNPPRVGLQINYLRLRRTRHDCQLLSDLLGKTFNWLFALLRSMPSKAVI